MKKVLILQILVLFSIFSLQSQTVKNPTLINSCDSASYALGIMLSSNLLENHIDSLNYNALILGVIDGFKTYDQYKITNSELHSTLKHFVEQNLRQKFKEKITIGENFLRENKNRTNIITTKSGLQYEILQQGKGSFAELYDSVSVYHKGLFLDSTIFDSNIGSPIITLPLIEGMLIPAWTEILQLMQEGTKVIMYVPYELGYGDTGNKIIKPFETLVYEIELVEIVKQYDDTKFDMKLKSDTFRILHHR